MRIQSSEQWDNPETRDDYDQMLTKEIVDMVRIALPHAGRREMFSYIRTVMDSFSHELGEGRLRGLSRVDFLELFKAKMKHTLEIAHLQQQSDDQGQLSQAFSNVYAHVANRDQITSADMMITPDFVDKVCKEILQKSGLLVMPDEEEIN